MNLTTELTGLTRLYAAGPVGRRVVRMVEKTDDGCGSFRPRRQPLQGTA